MTDINKQIPGVLEKINGSGTFVCAGCELSFDLSFDLSLIYSLIYPLNYPLNYP